MKTFPNLKQLSICQVKSFAFRTLKGKLGRYSNFVLVALLPDRTFVTMYHIEEEGG